MKKIFFSALAVLSLAACMQDEVMDIPTGGAISFENAYVGNATKADVVTTSNLEAFKVWGYVNDPAGVLFAGTQVNKTQAGWTYEGTQYWAPNNQYYFAAVAPISANCTLASYPGTIKFTNDANTDLIYASKQVASKAAGEANAAVAFEFNHLLSKVKLTFKNGFPTENVVVALTEINMTTPATGDFSTTDETWANYGQDQSLAFTSKEIAAGVTETTVEEYFILPTEAGISFDVEVFINGVSVYTGEKTASLPAETFEMGHAYNLSAEIDADALNFDEIVFTVDRVNEWVEAPNASDEAANLAYAAQVGGTYTLTKDVTVKAPIEVKKGVDFVLDLNGKTITAELKQEGRHHYAIDNYGTLTLKNGTIIARGVENFGKMVIEDGVTITNIDTNGGSAIWNEGNLVINGGTFTTNDKAGEGSYGGALSTQEGGTAVINGGYFEANSQLTYAICNYGETVINNARVVGKHGAVAAAEDAKNTTVINGGSFSLMENPGVSDHCAFYVSEIKGGTFTLGANTDGGAKVFYESTIADGYKAVENSGIWTIVYDAVNSVDEFKEALADNTKDVIYLAPGATLEGTFTIKRSVKVLSYPENPATIKGRLNISNSDVHFENINFASNDESTAVWTGSASSYLKYKSIVMIYGASTLEAKFIKCNFNYEHVGTAITCITKLTLENCSLKGSDGFYSKTRTKVTGCTFELGENSCAAYLDGCESEGGYFTFTDNVGNNIYQASAFMSTTSFGTGHYTFDVKNNTGFESYYYPNWTSRVTNKSFASNSETF